MQTQRNTNKQKKQPRKVLQSAIPYYKVLFTTALHYKILFCTTLCYKVLLRTTKVLQGTTPGLLCTTKSYSSTTPYYKVLHSTPRRSRESSPGPLASKANALSSRQIFWADHTRKVLIANTMRGAIVQIQNTNVHTPRTMRGAIPRDQNLRFATVSRDRPAGSYERVHPAKSKCAFRYKRRAIKNFQIYVLLQRRAQKCMKQVSDVQGTSRHTKIIVLPQFRTSDKHEVTTWLPVELKNLHFTTVFWASDDHFSR